MPVEVWPSPSASWRVPSSSWPAASATLVNCFWVSLKPTKTFLTNCSVSSLLSARVAAAVIAWPTTGSETPLTGEVCTSITACSAVSPLWSLYDVAFAEKSFGMVTTAA